MKIRIIAASILLVICIGAPVFCMLHAKKCAGELSGQLETALAAAAVESTDWEKATQEATRIWERDKSFYHILLPHSNLNELEWSLGSLTEYLTQGEQKLYIEQCVRAMQCVNTLREMETPTWGNVF